MRRFLSAGNVALAVLGVLTVLLLMLAIQKQDALSSPGAAVGTPQPIAASTARATAALPSVAFIGDGWTSGTSAGGEGPANVTALLASRNGWRVTNTARYGAGYTSVPKLDDQVAELVAADPRLVVVSGGRADDGAAPSDVRAAAERLYAELRARLPQASVVVIGPMWIGSDEPPRRLRDVRDAVRDAAAAERLPFVDPIADRWFVGRDADGIASDGEKLSNRGHQRLADLVGDGLRTVGGLPG